MKILVVEDEADLSQSICDYLANEGQYVCERAADYAGALDKILMYDYACIILDIGLPGGSGLQLLAELKKADKLDGVLIVSARNAPEDRVLGLKAGADDYLVKPFYLPELAARVSAIIRRKSFGGRNLISFDKLVLDLNEKTVKVNDIPLDLTRKEYELLVYFVSNKNKVIPKHAIAEHLWGDDMDIAGSYDFIYTHIKNIRKKLIAAGGEDYIKSIYGMGYKFSTS